MEYCSQRDIWTASNSCKKLTLVLHQVAFRTPKCDILDTGLSDTCYGEYLYIRVQKSCFSGKNTTKFYSFFLQGTMSQNSVM